MITQRQLRLARVRTGARELSGPGFFNTRVTSEEVWCALV